MSTKRQPVYSEKLEERYLKRHDKTVVSVQARNFISNFDKIMKPLRLDVEPITRPDSLLADEFIEKNDDSLEMKIDSLENILPSANALENNNSELSKADSLLNLSFNSSDLENIVEFPEYTVILMIAHDGIKRQDLWKKFLLDSKCGAVIYVNAQFQNKIDPFFKPFLLINESVDKFNKYGDLVPTTVSLMAQALLQYPNLKHGFLVPGNSLPIKDMNWFILLT